MILTSKYLTPKFFGIILKFPIKLIKEIKELIQLTK